MQWTFVDSIQIETNTLYQRAYYDQHAFDLIFPYTNEHSLLHPDLIQNDLISFAPNNLGIYTLGVFKTGVAITYQTITTDSSVQVFKTGTYSCPVSTYMNINGTCNACLDGCQYCINEKEC